MPVVSRGEQHLVRAGLAAAAPAAVKPPAAAVVNLPAGLTIPVGPTAPITGTQAVGSLIQGRVPGDIKDKNRVLVPAGATVRGRIRRMEKYTENGGYFIVGLEFTDMEWARFARTIFAEFLDMDHAGGIEAFLHSSTLETRQVDERHFGNQGYNETIRTGSLPSVGIFFVRGGELNLRAGFKTIWKTSSLRSATP